jgi:hypothetical protein
VIIRFLALDDNSISTKTCGITTPAAVTKKVNIRPLTMTTTTTMNEGYY